MDKKELKKLMTKLAKGKISQKEVDLLIKPKKVHQNQPHKVKSTHTRKRSIKSKEVK